LISPRPKGSPLKQRGLDRSPPLESKRRAIQAATASRNAAAPQVEKVEALVAGEFGTADLVYADGASRLRRQSDDGATRCNWAGLASAQLQPGQELLIRTRRNNQWIFVFFRSGNGRHHCREVKVSPEQEGKILILDELQSRQGVVTDGSWLLDQIFQATVGS